MGLVVAEVGSRVWEWFWEEGLVGWRTIRGVKERGCGGESALFCCEERSGVGTGEEAGCGEAHVDVCCVYVCMHSAFVARGGENREGLVLFPGLSVHGGGDGDWCVDVNIYGVEFRGWGSSMHAFHQTFHGPVHR